jgi:HK97 family phage major capsid protein
MNLETLVPELKAALTPELKQVITAQLSSEREAWEGSLKKQIEALGAKFDDHVVKAAYEAQVKRLDALEALINNPNQLRPEQVKSAAELFTSSQQFKDFAGRAWHKGGQSLQIAGSLWDSHPIFGRKTTIDSSALGLTVPHVLTSERLPGVQFAATRRLRVRDLIPFGSTDQAAVDFIKESTFTNAAYPQTEGSAKAESALTFTVVQAPVRTIAHWIPVTRQALDDAAQLQAAINFRLLTGLADTEDYELLRGDGSGQHVSGLCHEATAFDSSLLSAGDTYIDKLGVSLEQLESGDRNATGIVLHPGDWRKITRQKTDVNGANTGDYIMGGPGMTAAARLWDLPIALTTAMPRGHFLTGDFVRGTQGFDRMQAKIDISTEHSDFFTTNKVAIRAEERIALAVFRGDYFIYGAF